MLDFSSQRVGLPLAILVEGEPVRVLIMQSTLANELRLAGRWTQAEAEELAARMRAERGVPTQGAPIRGSDLINRGRPTLELAVVLQPGDEFFDQPSVTLERDNKELRFGPIASFEVESAFEVVDRDQGVSIGYKVVDAPAYRQFTRNAGRRSVGVFVAEELVEILTFEGEMPGAGVLTGGEDGLSDAEFAELWKHFAPLREGR
ncbi:MAG: hypothetical protein CMJ94_00215 [Planctomycetes bacterium]|nr:hypothetical protein [Planctomycetota bacterium]